MIEALAVPEALQKHWAFHGARLKRKEKHKGHDIFLADGGPHFDAKNHRIVKLDPGPDELLEEDKWMRDGYYVSAWAIQRGKLVIGFPLYFRVNHDPALSAEARSDARMNSALYAAKEVIDTMIHHGLLDHYEGRILMASQ